MAGLNESDKLHLGMESFSGASFKVLLVVFGIFFYLTPGTVVADPELEAATQAQEQLGKRAFFRCRACHGLSKDETYKIGPHLYGLFGRKAGSVADFNYSPALAASGLVWDRETLGKWLENPAALVPDNTMAYAGTKDNEELEALLVYLYKNTR